MGDSRQRSADGPCAAGWGDPGRLRTKRLNALGLLNDAAPDLVEPQ